MGFREGIRSGADRLRRGTAKVTEPARRALKARADRVAALPEDPAYHDSAYHDSAYDNSAYDKQAADTVGRDRPSLDRPSLDRPSFDPSSDGPPDSGPTSNHSPTSDSLSGTSDAESVRSLDAESTRSLNAESVRSPILSKGPARSADRSGNEDPAAVPGRSLVNNDAVPRGLQIAAGWAWRVLIVGVLVYALGWGVRYLSEVIVPLSVATLLAALLSPVSNRLKKWGLPRGLAVALSVIGGMALVAGTLTLVGQQIASQSSSLVSQVTKGFDQLLAWAKNGPLGVDTSQLGRYVDQLQDFLVASQSEIASYAADVGAQVGHFVAGFAITIFALFYFLYDGRRIWSFLLNFVPSRARPRADHAARRGWTSLVSYVRATIVVALVDAIGVLIVALILQVPVAPALATLVFLGAFIPLVGAFVSGFVAVIVALVALGWVQALIMLAGIIVVMQLEGHVLQPFLLGRAVKLHPLAVLLGIAVGIIVGGIVGALMSIPLLAFSKTFIQDLVTAPSAEPRPRSLVT